MKSLFKSAFLVVLTFFSQKALAQPVFSTSEANINETVQEIFHLYGSQIDLEYAEVYDFVKTIVIGADPDHCRSPQPSVQSVDQGNVAFAWNQVPDAKYYETAYLNLNNGVRDFVDTDQPEITFKNMKGLVLFGFNTICSNKRKSLNEIIIVDVDILYPTPPEGQHCFCSQPHIIPINNFASATSMSWPGICNNSKYRLRVDGTLSGNSYYSEVSFVHGQASIPNIIYLLPWCDINAQSSSSGPLFAGDNGLWDASFTHSSLVINPLPSNNFAISSINLEVCSCKNDSDGGKGKSGGQQSESNDGFRLSPNPGSGIIQVSFDLSASSKTTIEVFDLLGKKIKTIYQQTPQNSGQYQIEVDVNSWPAGVYTFHLATDKQSQIVLFSKN